MKKRILAIVMAFSIAVNGNLAVAAESLPEANSISEGTIEISSKEDLQDISADLSADYILMDDIDLSKVEWKAVGDNEKPFTGSFDGNGHTVTNLNLKVTHQEDSSYAGLFGVTDGAEISNLAIENCEITSETRGGIYAGALVGKAKNTVIEDCYVDGQIIVEKKTAYTIGGIVGAVFQQEADTDKEYNVSHCISNVKIDTNKYQGESGTLAGYVENTALLENSYSLVPDVSLFGIIIEDTSCKILNAYSWQQKNKYVGFDFETIWKITWQGARLQGQKVKVP